MMFPVAVDGHMPFVDNKKYRDARIAHVIAKQSARRRHCSGPDGSSHNGARIQSKNAKSMPHLNQDAVSSPKLSRPRFISLPSLEYSLQQQELKQDTKTGILESIKAIFGGKKRSKKQSKDPYQPQYSPKTQSRARSHSAPIDILAKSRMNVNGESGSPPGVSPKRQRTRTVSNISSVMETIEEIPENLTLEDETDTDSDSASASTSSSSSSIDLTFDQILATASEPPMCSHFLRTGGSSNSLLSLHSSNGEITCAA